MIKENIINGSKYMKNYKSTGTNKISY